MRAVAIALALIVVGLPGCLKGLTGGDPPGPRDYVSSKDYDKWVVEVDTVQGMAPPASAMTMLKQRLESVASKPGGIELRTDDSLPAHGGSWSVKDLQAYSAAHLDAETKGDTVVLHLLFLDGQFQQENVLGVTISSSRGGRVVSSGPIAIFTESVRDACANPLALCTNPEPIFGPVLVHEFGHAMGLVNAGAPMKTPHEDTSHPGHSSNTGSVMYWEVETSGVTALIRGGVPNDYDANDRADLCGIGGKC